MSEENNLNTHQPTCGSGEPSLHDEEILDLHARLLREKKKPILAFHIAPLVLVFMFGGIIFWAGLALSLKTGFFHPDVYDIHWEKESALKEIAKKEGAVKAGPSAVVKKGKKLYNTAGACVTCHQANGQGLADFPPLAGSEWVTGSPEILTRVVVHGLQGKIEVNGKEYGNVPMVPTIWKTWSDADIASVLSYIRNDWGNEASEIDVETVSKIRAQEGERGPWTADELSEI